MSCPSLDDSESSHQFDDHGIGCDIGYEELANEEANTLWQSYLYRTLHRNDSDAGAELSSTEPDEKNGGGSAVMASLLSSVSIPSQIFTAETRHLSMTPFWTPTTHKCSPWAPKESPDCTFVKHDVLLKDICTVDDMGESLKTLGRLVEMEQEFDGGQDMNETLDGLRRIYGDGSFEIRWPSAVLLTRKR